MRNIEKQIKQAEKIIEKHPRSSIYVDEMDQLKKIFDKRHLESGFGNAIYNLIIDSYKMGIAVGYRTAKNEK